MTSRNSSPSDQVLELLREAGVDDDPALVRAVEGIAQLGEGPLPDASAELAQLMASGGKASRVRRSKGRVTFIGGALAVSMGVGMSGVAADPVPLRHGFDDAVDTLTRHSLRDDAARLGASGVAGPDAVRPPSGPPAVASSGQAAPVSGATGPSAAAAGSAHEGSAGDQAGEVPRTASSVPSTSFTSSDATGSSAVSGTAASSVAVPDAGHGAAPDAGRDAGATPATADPGAGTAEGEDTAGADERADEPTGPVDEMFTLLLKGGTAEDWFLSPGSDAGHPDPGPVWLRTPATDPGMVALPAEPLDGESQWLALFFVGEDLWWEAAPQDGVPDAEPGEPLFGEPDPVVDTPMPEPTADVVPVPVPVPDETDAAPVPGARAESVPVPESTDGVPVSDLRADSVPAPRSTEAAPVPRSTNAAPVPDPTAEPSQEPAEPADAARQDDGIPAPAGP